VLFGFHHVSLLFAVLMDFWFQIFLLTAKDGESSIRSLLPSPNMQRQSFVFGSKLQNLVHTAIHVIKINKNAFVVHRTLDVSG